MIGRWFEPAVKTYDLYLFGHASDVIVGWHKFDSEDDEAAVALVAALSLTGPHELWCDVALVMRWDPS